MDDDFDPKDCEITDPETGELTKDQVSWLHELAEKRRQKWRKHEQLSTDKITPDEDLPKCSNVGTYSW